MSIIRIMGWYIFTVIGGYILFKSVDDKGVD